MYSQIFFVSKSLIAVYASVNRASDFIHIVYLSSMKIIILNCDWIIQRKHSKNTPFIIAGDVNHTVWVYIHTVNESLIYIVLHQLWLKPSWECKIQVSMTRSLYSCAQKSVIGLQCTSLQPFMRRNRSKYNAIINSLHD